MNNREVINWQMVDRYYPYLVQKIQWIDSYLMTGHYGFALEQLEQIFIHIAREIQKDKEVEKKYDDLNTAFKDIKSLVYQYEIVRKNPKPNKRELIEITTIKTKLETRTKEIYKIIFWCISDLNMFFPRVQKEVNRIGKEVLQFG